MGFDSSFQTKTGTIKFIRYIAECMSSLMFLCPGREHGMGICWIRGILRDRDSKMADGGGRVGGDKRISGQ